MATDDKRINFYLKKFLSVDQVDSNLFQYLIDRLVDVISQLYPQSGIWEPTTFDITGGSSNDTFTVAGGGNAVLMNNVADLLALAGALGTDIPFENVNAVDYYVGAKHIEIPDEPETNPRYNTPQWKLIRDAVGELADPDSVTDQGGGVFRFVVNSVTESGVDHSGRTCRVYLKTPVDLGNNYLEATIAYSGGNNYIDLTTGGALGDISTDETLYSAVVEGYTWKRNTDLSTLPEYAFIGIVTGNGPGAIPTVFDTSGQIILPRIYTDTDFSNLLNAYKLEHLYQPGTGTHGAITADSIGGKGSAELIVTSTLKSALDLEVHADIDIHLRAKGHVIVDVDYDDTQTDRYFRVRKDGLGTPSNLFNISETGHVDIYGDLDGNNAGRARNFKDPASAQDLATKQFIDSRPTCNLIKRTSSFGSSLIYAIAHNGKDGASGRWVAVGIDKIATSDDGYTWTQRSHPLGTGAIYDVAYNGSNLWVAVGSSGRLATSPDGVTWTSRTSGFGSSSIWGVAHDQSGLWVIVGADNKIATSPDGINWTTRTSPFTPGTITIFCVAHDGSGLWAIGGQSNRVASSPDGINWTARTAHFLGRDIRGIAHDHHGLWVIGGEDGYLETSADGITWDGVLAVPFTDDIQCVSHNWINLWMLSGLNGLVALSKDGKNWHQKSDSTFNVLSSNVMGIAGDRGLEHGNKVVVAGSNGDLAAGPYQY